MNEKNVLEKKCYTVEEVMSILGICRTSVMKLLHENSFKWFRVGSVYRISMDSFDRWLETLNQEEPTS